MGLQAPVAAEPAYPDIYLNLSLANNSAARGQAPVWKLSGATFAVCGPTEYAVKTSSNASRAEACRVLIFTASLSKAVSICLKPPQIGLYILLLDACMPCVGTRPMITDEQAPIQSCPHPP